ncbi:MAG: phytase [Rhodothermaceae bacterium]|nr:phytase [Rhodothermaceae bacterium]
MKLPSIAATLVLLCTGCVTEQPALEQEPEISVIEEAYFTTRDTTDNVDSPAIWHGPEGQNWLIATAKETDLFLIYEAETGYLRATVGGGGSLQGQLDRPNGVVVFDDMVAVVERDNARVQVFMLPGFESVGTMGEDELRLPYGLTVYPIDSMSYMMYVTDNYETEDEQVPADSLLDKRVHQYAFAIKDSVLSFEYVKAFGETEGPGVLRVVESLWVDASNNRLLIAEELEGDSQLKGYTLDGAFSGDIVDASFFPNQAEGITLFECENGSGYWITTDQADEMSTFHLFDRTTLEHVGSFRGSETKNTDGIALTQVGFGDFDRGAFFAVHDDGNVAAFDWGKVMDAVGVSGYCE